MKMSNMTNYLIGQPMFELKKKIREYQVQGKEILHFEIGDSHWDAPRVVGSAVVRSIRLGETHYTASGGMMELKEEIVKATHKEYHMIVKPSQILVIPANAVIDFVVRCLCEKDDEVIVTDPCFPTYTSVLSYTGVKAVKVNILGNTNHNADYESIKSAMTDKTKLVIVNSPCNPTGGIIHSSELAAIQGICEAKGIPLLCDEVYSGMIYNKEERFSPVTLDKCQKNVILLKSFSKIYSMTGYRLGYVIAPEPLVEKMTLLFQTIFSCMPVFIQRAGIAALNCSDAVLDKRLRHLDRCRRMLVDGLNSIKGIDCNIPNGAFYVFPSIKGTGKTSSEIADLLLEKAGVAVLPGNNFGESGEGYIRLCYATDKEVIQKAITKMKEVLC